ncbi:unnamed protein product [Blepharisma stoltei]|uniref:ubiquitinyl hydrolase 1 n=1 Tax=Blepharisma stoltei TaxID=1481888 RepID=A0AAU9JUC9_9CILI|nr:unnamed protein product [Blepharisma stoltei]
MGQICSIEEPGLRPQPLHGKALSERVAKLEDRRDTTESDFIILNQSSIKDVSPDDRNSLAKSWSVLSSRSTLYSENALEDRKSTSLGNEIGQANDARSQAQSLHPNKIFSCALDFEEYPETVSKFWIPIEKMTEIGKFNKTFVQNVKQIKEKGFGAWRKSRGDGNCYYRAVFLMYLENLFSFRYDYTETLWNLINFLENMDYEIPFTDFLDNKLKFIAYMKILMKVKESSYTDAFVEFKRVAQVRDFDLAMIATARLLAAYKIASNDPSIAPFIFEDQEMMIMQILTMGEEAEGIALLTLPISLGIQVIQYNFFDKVVEQKFPEENDSNFSPIFIIRRGGHYDILCKKSDLEAQNYDLKTGTYLLPL